MQSQWIRWRPLIGILLGITLCYAGYTSSMVTPSQHNITESAAPKIIELVPPQLNADAILEELTCDMPVSSSSFDITAKTIHTSDDKDKLVVTCTGLGGSGWTNLWGAVDEALALFEAQNIDKSTPIRIIGAGCVGLAATVKLAHLGYNITGITAKERYDLPSWKAAGYFGLVSIDTSAEEQARVERISVATFRAYQEIEQGTCPYLTRDVIRMLPVYCSQETTCGLEELEANGLIPPVEKVILDFCNGVRHPNFLQYMTYFVDTTKIMQQLTQEVERLGIPIRNATIKAFSDCEEPVVFNCSGLGDKDLNQDNTLMPVRGHLFTLNDKSGTKHMDYMIYTAVQQDGQKEYVHMFPQGISVSAEHPAGIACNGVIGGTFVKGTDLMNEQELEDLDKKMFQRMLDRSMAFFHGPQRH